MIRSVILSALLGAALVFVTYKVVKKRKPKEWEPANDYEDQTHNPFAQ